jgi:heme exporter protein D
MIDMGRYGAFVWPAYGVSAAGFMWMIIDSLLRARHWRREAMRLRNAPQTEES